MFGMSLSEWMFTIAILGLFIFPFQLSLVGSRAVVMTSTPYEPYRRLRARTFKSSLRAFAIGGSIYLAVLAAVHWYVTSGAQELSGWALILEILPMIIVYFLRAQLADAIVAHLRKHL